MSATKKILVAVLVLGAIGSLLYGMGVFKSAAPPEMTMGMQPIKDRQSGKMIMQPTFAFSAPVRIRSVRVYNAKEYADQGQYALPMWSMVGTPASEPVREFVYGQRIGRMKPEKQGIRPVQLIRDQSYCMVMTCDRGTFQKQFVYGPKQDAEQAP